MEPVVRRRFLLYEKYKPPNRKLCRYFKYISELSWLTQQMVHQWHMSQAVLNTIIMWMLQERLVWLHALCHRPHDDL
jgi:hypothetical protein